VRLSAKGAQKGHGKVGGIMTAIHELKAQQDADDRRKARLLGGAWSFKNGFKDSLEESLKQAEEAKLRGVKPLETISNSEEMFEARCTMANRDLVIISTDEVYPLEPYGDERAAKIFVYIEDVDQARPWVALTLIDPGGERYSCEMERFDEKGSPIRVNSWESVDASTGQKAAEALLILSYRSFSSLWMDRPTLMAMRKREGERRPFGFPLPEV
jgi:hypothetical protein